jgi:hypothetical protein
VGAEAGAVDAHTNKTNKPTSPVTDAQSQYRPALVRGGVVGWLGGVRIGRGVSETAGTVAWALGEANGRQPDERLEGG